MSLWYKAAKQFEENSHDGKYFETHSVDRALKLIFHNIEHNSPQMLFLLGEPGSGKTFLLNYLTRHYEQKRYTLLIENPFLTPVELLKRMLAFAHIEHEEEDVEAMRLLAVKAYKDTPHIIMLDEAQLSSEPLMEFVRILSDSKVFWFLIAMHRAEGEELLKSTHFYSRPHQVIQMGELRKDECLPFLKKTLDGPELLGVLTSLDKPLIEKSWKLSNGNFRSFKKLYYNVFLLLDHAYKRNETEILKPNMKLFEMAAIKAGLNLPKRELNKVVLGSNGSMFAKFFGFGILFFILLFGSIFGLKYIFDGHKEDIVNAFEKQKIQPIKAKVEKAKNEQKEEKAVEKKKKKETQVEEKQAVKTTKPAVKDLFPKKEDTNLTQDKTKQAKPLERQLDFYPPLSQKAEQKSQKKSTNQVEQNIRLLEVQIP